MSVKQEILAQIQRNGYVTIEHFMQLALNSSVHSYYRFNQKIGQDFITSGEISQLFGEMLALWVIMRWQQLGMGAIVLVELGPGNGNLMFDVLRTIAKLAPELFANINKVVLLEINPNYMQLQSLRLESFNLKIQHIAKLEELDGHKAIFIANEFFDAMPIEQYIRKDNSWRELVVRSKNQDLYFDDISSSAKFLPYTNVEQGSILETSPATIAVMDDLCNFIACFGGAAVIIDYGYYINPAERQPGQYISTLQAMSRHNFLSPLQSPGESDLTAHVDFWSLAQVAQKYIANFAISSQEQFLHRFGINHRAKNLALASPYLADVILEQYKYLVNNMGQLFLVLEIIAAAR